MASIEINAIDPNKATYKPGEMVEIDITLTNQSTRTIEANIAASYKYLTQEVMQVHDVVELPPKCQQDIQLTWNPPPDSPRGYGVDVAVTNADDQVLATCHSAFDVLTSWTQAPRYGFLSDFVPNRGNAVETAAWLARYHINGLQFYDWMYRHDEFLTDQEPYCDPLGRELSRKTVDTLIEAVHAHNIAAMPYTAIYAASLPFFEKHRDWALYDEDGNPHYLGEDFLAYMNPDPSSPWIAHLVSQFTAILEETEFDGIHLDQYGDPKIAYDAVGGQMDLAQVLPVTINLIKETATNVRPDSRVVFNCVNNWPIETVAKSQQDFVYIEVWPPHIHYSDLHSIVVEAQELSGGKPVVLAAYIDPSRARNARLADAVIFASGGFHIELGEPGAMLADAYFPKYKHMDDGLAKVMRRYYDFAVRYENVLSIETRNSTESVKESLVIEDVHLEYGEVNKRAWAIARQGEGFHAINLINLSGLTTLEWNGSLLADPTPLDELRVRFYTEDEVKSVWFASPDSMNPQARALSFDKHSDIQGSHIVFTIPRLEFWNLVVVELTK
jgi:dextranase